MINNAYQKTTFSEPFLKFLFPIFLVVKHNNFSKTTNFLLISFILASLFQIAFIDPSASIPNAILFDYMIFVYLFYEFKLNVIYSEVSVLSSSFG